MALAVLVGAVVTGVAGFGNTASADLGGAYLKVIALCRPTRSTVRAVVITNTSPKAESLLVNFVAVVPGAHDNQESVGYFFKPTGLSIPYSFTTASVYDDYRKHLPLPARPITIFWSSDYFFQTVNKGSFANVGIGCPSTVTNAAAAPAVVSIGKVVKARLFGELAPKNVTEKLLNTSLLFINGYGVLKNASGGTTTVTWQFRRASTTKPWTGKLTVSLPALGGRGIFAQNISVSRAKNGLVTGRATRRVTLNGRLETEVANWQIGPLAK